MGWKDLFFPDKRTKEDFEVCAKCRAGGRLRKYTGKLLCNKCFRGARKAAKRTVRFH